MIPNRSPGRLLACANSRWNISHFRGDLLRALEAQGFLVEVAAPVGDEVNPGWSWPFYPLPMRNDGLNPAADGLLLSRMLRLLRNRRPDAYLSWTAKPNIYGSLAAGLLGVPAFPNVSGLGTAYIRGGPLQLLLSALYRVAFRRAPAVFFQNREDLQLFVSRRLVRADQARLVPGSGVDLDRFPAMPLAERPAGAAVFLFVGRLLGDKGVRELVAAARQVRASQPMVRFQLLGAVGAANRTAINRSELDRWVTDGVVEYLGTSDDVRPYLAAADAVILPSYREGMPRSLLEAAASARPMLASDVPGCREIVEDGVNGMLFPSRSANALATVCLRFLRLPPAERDRMAAAARRTVEERFSTQRVIDAYGQALRDIVQRPAVTHRN